MHANPFSRGERHKGRQPAVTPRRGWKIKGRGCAAHRDDGCVTTPRRRHARRLTARSSLRVMCPQRTCGCTGLATMLCQYGHARPLSPNSRRAAMQLGRDPSHRRCSSIRAGCQPRLGSRIALGFRPHRLWRRVYETLAELASRIDADTQGKIISAAHSRVPIVTPNEQRAPRVRSRPPPEKALRHEGAKEPPQNKPPISGTTDAGTLPFPRVPSLPLTEQEGMQTEHAEIAKERTTQAVRGANVESGLSGLTTAEEFRTILVHLLHHTPFR